MSTGHEDNMSITREAARWYMELHTEGSACYEEFARWLRRSPEHIEEFLAITGVSRKLDKIDPQRRIDVHELMADQSADVVRFLPANNTKRTRARWTLGLAVAAAFVGGALLLLQWIASGSQTYVTHIGEQRVVKLSDGSMMYLNTKSRAAVDFSKSAREVRLVDGEALFVVEHDAARPFRVKAGNTVVQAVGTQFDVYNRPEGATVTVVEGMVQLSETSAVTQVHSASTTPTRLTAGEQADTRHGHIAKQAVADVKSVTAWRERQLVFRDEPLADVAAEFNRYNTLQFQVDADAGREPLSGVFAADRPDSLLLFLAKDESVQIERRGDLMVIHSRHAGP